MTGSSIYLSRILTTLLVIPEFIGLILGTLTIDKIGRKPLYLSSIILVSMNWTAFSISGYLNLQFLQKYYIFLFFTIFGIGMGSVLNVYLSEILPLSGNYYI